MQNCYSAKEIVSKHKKDPAFIMQGFVSRKDTAMSFQKHQCSKCHQEATAAEALIHFSKQIERDIEEMLKHEHHAEKITK